MKLVSFDDFQIGVLRDDGVVNVTSVLPDVPGPLQCYRMNLLIEEWDTLKPQVEKLAKDGSAVAMDSVKLLAPVPAPRKVYAAPANYHAHRAEMEAGAGGSEAAAGQHHSGEFGMFLKSPSSVVGPQDTILRPYEDRLIHHESELVLVMGKRGSAIPLADSLSYVFGYTCGLDITVRGPEDRSKRKSFDTFSPTGPYIVTADEIADPGDLEISLWVNEDLKQHAFTKDLITDCPNLIANMSWVAATEPGDLLFTGTPDGVGEIKPGDLVSIKISEVGEMSVPVKARTGPNPERD
jgi:2-keto-4-pentenoate hydratase/2-oxohepta-3-ene-1,7-dioic acid hydratase in catechol pathway